MCRKSVARRQSACCCAFVFLLAFGLGQPLAVGGPIDNVIEIDGNPQNDALPGLDWCCLDDGTCLGDPRVFLFSGRVFDLCPDSPDAAADDNVVCVPAGDKETNSAFTQDTKDIQEIGIELNGDWRHTVKSVPDKNDIVNAMAALLQDPASGHLILAFAGDRFATNGDAQIGAWFLQNAISPDPDGTFSGVHEVGDILVLADYVNGGVIADLEFCVWLGEGNVPCTSILDNPNAQAANNVGDEVDTCWAYRTKAGGFPAGKYPDNSFFSAAIDLTAMSMDGTCTAGVCDGGARDGLDCVAEEDCNPILPNPPGCLGTFLLETRASQSITARLHDFALGGFDTCADIHGKKEQVDDDGLCASNPVDLPNWEIRLLDADGELVTVDGDGNALTNPVCTDTSGEYWFMNLPIQQDYTVCEVVPARAPEENFNWSPCLPNPGVVGDLVTPGACGASSGIEFCYDPFTLEDTVAGKDFRNFKRVIPTDLRGVKFCDENGNGSLDPEDTPLAGFCLVLTKPDGSTATAVSAANGSYEFVVNSGEGPYSITEDLTGVACGSADMSGEWVATTTLPLSADPAPGQTLIDGLNIGNTSIPDIDCGTEDESRNNDPGLCSANFCFTPTATNECGSFVIACTAEGGVTLTQDGDQWCGDFPAGCPATTQVTCTVTTAAGQTDECVFNVSVTDNEAPQLSGVPDDFTGQCDDDIPAVAAVTCSDNCDDLTPVFSETDTGTCPRTIVRTWTCTDSCGNSVTDSQTIVVNDTTPPTLNGVPDDATGQCDEDVPAPAMVTCSDNCDGEITPVLSETDEGTCPRTITRTWTCTDTCGNSVSDSQIIVINDTTPPALNGVPEDVTGQCDEDVPAVAMVTCSDNCDGEIDPVFSETDEGTCPRTITRTWTCTDACGNSVTDSQTIVINDTTPPALNSVPDDATGQCDEDVPPVATVTCSDNCDGEIGPVFSETDQGTCPRTITRTWTCTDTCGNSVSDSQVIVINDTTAPMLDGVPDDATGQCDEDVPPVATVTCSDNCDGAIDPVFSETDEGTCPRTITRTWTCTDTCGNSVSDSQVIVINDTTAPVLNGVPDDATGQCDEDVPPVAMVTCSDNCDGEIDPVFSYTDEGTCPRTITRTWTCTDTCGNSVSDSQVIVINDTTAPVLSGVPGPVAVECDDDVPAPATVTCEDNCDGPLTPVFGEVDDGNTCPRVITRTWTCTDTCGNSVSESQEITVDDITPPTITCPAGKGEAICGEEFVLDVTPDDNCDPAPSCDCTFSDPNDPDRFTWRRLGDCQFGVTLSGTTTVTATCTASDDCNNTSTECVFDMNAFCGQACSPGFWRNLPQHLPEWCEYTPFQPNSEGEENSCPGKGAATLFLDAFSEMSGVPIESCQPAIDAGSSFYDEMTLYEAVGMAGGADQTLFHCSAALLNSYAVAFPVDPLAVEQVISGACDGSISWTDAFGACRDWNAVEFAPGGCCPFSDPDCPLPAGTSGARSSLGRLGGK